MSLSLHITAKAHDNDDDDETMKIIKKEMKQKENVEHFDFTFDMLYCYCLISIFARDPPANLTDLISSSQQMQIKRKIVIAYGRFQSQVAKLVINSITILEKLCNFSFDYKEIKLSKKNCLNFIKYFDKCKIF